MGARSRCGSIQYVVSGQARTTLTLVVQSHELTETLVEIIGQVVDESTIKFVYALSLQTKELGKYAFFVLLTSFTLLHRHEVGK